MALHKSFDLPPDQLFDWIEEVPIACGSIGQVHRARLSEKGAALTCCAPGEVVAVKVSSASGSPLGGEIKGLLGWIARGVETCACVLRRRWGKAEAERVLQFISHLQRGVVPSFCVITASPSPPSNNLSCLPLPLLSFHHQIPPPKKQQVRHPGVCDAIERDFQTMVWVTHVATQLFPSIRTLRLEDTLKQFAAPLHEQVGRIERGVWVCVLLRRGVWEAVFLFVAAVDCSGSALHCGCCRRPPPATAGSISSCRPQQKAARLLPPQPLSSPCNAPPLPCHHHQPQPPSKVDLSREAANLQRFNTNFRRTRSVSFPEPLYPLVSPDVLVESFEAGKHIRCVCDCDCDCV